MLILVIDNHDSFVYNIVGLLRQVRDHGDFPDLEWDVRMNDDVDVQEVERYDAVILSPGPGVPSEAGMMMEIIDRYVRYKPFLGVCLGFQAIAEYFGAALRLLAVPRHGHMSGLCLIDHDDPLVGHLHSTAPMVGRYHSWIVAPESLPSCLVPTSYDEEGNIMSLRHRDLPVFGTQFHPESVISDCGESLLSAFLRHVGLV